MAESINCKEIAQKIKNKLKVKIEKYNIKPVIASIVVGNNQGTKIYAASKIKACASIGIVNQFYELDEYTSEEDLLKLIYKLNEDESINAIMCEFPLPSHINKENIISAINPNKDVDCINPINLGYLFSSTPTIIPCTPLAVMEIINYTGVNLEGENAVMVGRSNIVGKPLATLLLKKNATVTIAHTKTRNLKEICLHASILCVSIGSPEFIKGNYIKKDALVIDVGINRVDNKIVGDVAFAEASHAKYITPVPGGVGPVTTATLMKNVVRLYEKQNSIN